MLGHRAANFVFIAGTVLVGACFYPPSQSPAAEVTQGLVGWWRFDGLEDGKVRELCGNGNPAELLGACRKDFDPKRGLHIPYRPVEGHALSKDHPFLRGKPTQLTVSAWVWWDGRGGGAALSCANRFVLGPRVWEVHCEEKFQRGWRAIIDSGMPPSKRWMHLAGVMDEERITFYRDGTVFGTKSLSKPMVGGSSDLRIARSFAVAKWQMPGYLWEVRLHNRALAGEEIAALASVRRAATPEDLPAAGLYLPGRSGQVAVPFEQPDCTPFVASTTRRLDLTDRDVAKLSMSGCGIYERADPSVWRDTGGFSLSGEASASAPVRARIVFVGWPRGERLKTPRLVTRVCDEPIDLTSKATRFRVAVSVPESVSSGIVMLAVADRRADPATLIGVTIKLGKFQYAPAAAGIDVRAGVSRETLPSVSSRDGLTLGLEPNGGVTALKTKHADLAGGGVLPMAGWFVTDLAATNVPIPLVGAVSETADGLAFTGMSKKLHLKYRMQILGRGPYLDCRGHLEDLSGQDRALMLEFRLPLSSEEPWAWHDGGYKRREVQPGRRYEMLSGALTPGGQRKTSGRPFAALSRSDAGLCLAVPLMDEPRLFRLFAYKPFVGDAVLGCEFEVGLSSATKHFPSRASYRFVVYSTESSWVFRHAAQKYYDFFPKQFTSTVKRHGNWAVLRMTQQYTPNMADFAIAADETVMGSPPADMYGSVANHLLGIATCPYVRPGTSSQEFKGSPSDKDAYETRMAVLAKQEELAEHVYMFPNPYWGSTLPVLARATRNSVLYDLDGRAIWRYNVVRRPGWFFSRCQQNCSYEIPKPNWAGVITRQYTLADDWSRDAGAPLGGVYFDNVCSVSINAFNFRRDHWVLARIPLVVNADPPQPAQSKVLTLCEFFAKFAAEVRRRGGFLIGNFINNADGFVLGQYFDFIGHEGYNGNAIERLRIMAGPKPASYLPTAPVTRDMFENCLSYGVAPGFHRASDRALYQEFMPLIVSLSESVWRAVPEARYSVEGAVVERFGAFGSGDLSFTVRHFSQDGPDGVLRVRTRGASIPDHDVLVVDMRRGRMIKPRWEPEWLVIPLPTQAGRTEVVRVCRPAAWWSARVARLAKALERAGREWNWVKAQRDDTLTARLGFDEDEGRWFRSGFAGAKVGLSPNAHSSESALLIESHTATDGIIKTEPFAIRQELPHRLAFHYRAEGTGEVKAKVVFRPSWFGGDPVGETRLGDVSLTSGWGRGWQRLEGEVQPARGGVRMYLQLDFHSFSGRFSIDSFSLCPCFEPLTEIPKFGFTELYEKLRSLLRNGDHGQIEALTRDIATRLATWRAAAARLPAGDGERMANEIAGIEISLDLCLSRPRNQ